MEHRTASAVMFDAIDACEVHAAVGSGQERQVDDVVASGAMGRLAVGDRQPHVLLIDPRETVPYDRRRALVRMRLRIDEIIGLYGSRLLGDVRFEDILILIRDRE